jgi:signal transduction histidine kinase/HAMP domain-containing protein/CheY-like chemotaxis protein
MARSAGTKVRSGGQERLLSVLRSMRDGDYSVRLNERPSGVHDEAAVLLNQVLDHWEQLSGELQRVSEAVCTQGRLHERVQVSPAKGAGAQNVRALNQILEQVSEPVSSVAQVLDAVAGGDLERRVELDGRSGPLYGDLLRLANSVNRMADQMADFTGEVTRVAREVGTEGKLGGRANVEGVSGAWRDVTEAVNSMASRLTDQVRDISRVTTAVAQGDLTRKVTVDVQGEMLALKNTVNTMVDQLSSFADEVTRVAREVGTEGQLGGRANVKGVSGIWKDLTNNVNSMAKSLTTQVRNISQVTTAVAKGDLTKKITVDAQGEILELKDTVNTMVDQLSSFADEVTRVAREVGSEGRLGGQAKVEGVSGTWKQLTDRVNELAGNLTTQVRAIGDVASAVTRGDLTRSISVEARGELSNLRDNINLMVSNLRESTTAQQDDDWLKSHLARISGIVQGHRDLHEVARIIMSEVTPLVEAQYGACYLLDSDEEDVYRLYAGYGYQPRRYQRRISTGEGLAGQVIAERQELLLNEVPGDYVKIESGLGQATPLSLAIFPIVSEGRVLGALELASFAEFRPIHLSFLRQLVDLIGATISSILANARTEHLLGQSQQLATELQERTNELQRQQEELRNKNAELHNQAGQLASRNRAIEMQNRQIERARQSLQERAEQLQASYRYKSEFLANMSHELRTPLNSLLILARLLADNSEGNLSGKQVEFAKTIHKAGTDLLQQIDGILDLSKVEAGRMEVHASEISVGQLVEYVEASFRPLANDKGLAFSIEVSPAAPAELWTDEQRLKQVLRNLLSNALKFTSSGEVRLLVRPALEVSAQIISVAPEEAIAFTVVDTGPGISDDQLQLIFEAFHQGEGGTSRRFGGTGLGLSISRNMARLLGGEIQVDSARGEGSSFTIVLPVRLPHGTEESVAASTMPLGSNGTPLLERADGLMGALDAEALPAAAPDLAEEPQPAADPEITPAAQPSAQGEEHGVLESSEAERRPERDAVLRGKRVLIVDDDVRNVFAMTSALEAHGLRVIYADNGAAGIEKLEANDDIALVLMDVMMPELDGDETTRRIREMPQFADLPIITLTAKAMRGDRERSLAHGASDYVTKPINLDHLLDVMRAWLDPAEGTERN